MIIGTFREAHILADAEILIGYYNTSVNTAYLQQSPMYTISLVTQGVPIKNLVHIEFLDFIATVIVRSPA